MVLTTGKHRAAEAERTTGQCVAWSIAAPAGGHQRAPSEDWPAPLPPFHLASLFRSGDLNAVSLPSLVRIRIGGQWHQSISKLGETVAYSATRSSPSGTMERRSGLGSLADGEGVRLAGGMRLGRDDTHARGLAEVAPTYDLIRRSASLQSHRTTASRVP